MLKVPVVFYTVDWSVVRIYNYKKSSGKIYVLIVLYRNADKYENYEFENAAVKMWDNWGHCLSNCQLASWLFRPFQCRLGSLGGFSVTSVSITEAAQLMLWLIPWLHQQQPNSAASWWFSSGTEFGRDLRL